MAWLKGNKVDCLIISDNILCLIKKISSTTTKSKYSGRKVNAYLW